MGHHLFTEVLQHAPAGLTKGERLVLFVFAHDFNDQTRSGWPGEDLLTRGTEMTDRGVRKAIEGLVERGVVQRVPIGNDKTGAPIYAHAGKRARFRIAELVHSPPEKAEPPCRLPSTEGGTPVPPPEGERRNQRAGKAEPASRKAEPPFRRPVISSQRSSHLPAREHERLAPVIEAVENRTGKTIDPDHARRVVEQIAADHPEARKPIAYAVAVIRNDDDPRRFLPTPIPERYRATPERTPR